MVDGPADDAEPERARGSNTPWPDLQQRGGPARGDDRLRRRPGDAGPRLPRRGCRCSSTSAPAIPVRLHVRDHDGTPTVGPLHVHRPLGPDVTPRSPSGRPPTCSSSGRSIAPTAACVLLPPGQIDVTYGRGPEYRLQSRRADRPRARRGDARRPARAVDRPGGPRLLQRRPPHPRRRLCPLHRPDAGGRAQGHVPPGQGRGPERRLRPDLGAVLRLPAPVLRPAPDGLSEPLTVIKYDVEVSGFGSQALGHVCLLNLRDQTYPGSEGTATKGWPTWTTPVLRWAKGQGAVTGYAHSGSGLEIDPAGRHRAPAGRPRPTTRTARSPDPRPHGACSRPISPCRRRPRRRAHPAGARSRPRTGRRDLAQSCDPRDERRRRDGGRRVGAAGRLRLHQRHGHAADRRMELLVPPAQLRLPAQGQRRDRFPLHERLAGRPGARLRPARRRQGRSTSTPGARASPPAGRTSPTASPTPLEFTVGGKRPGDRLELEKPGTGRRPGQGRLRRPDAARRRPRERRPGRAAAGSWATRSTCTGRRRDGEFTAGGESRARRVGGQRPSRRRDATCRPTTASTSWSSTSRSSRVAGWPFAISPDAHQPGRGDRGRTPDPGLAARAPLVPARSSSSSGSARGRTIAPAERDEARRAFDQAIESIDGSRREAPTGADRRRTGPRSYGRVPPATSRPSGR